MYLFSAYEGTIRLVVNTYITIEIIASAAYLEIKITLLTNQIKVANTNLGVTAGVHRPSIAFALHTQQTQCLNYCLRPHQ